jgi:hypothetical protein
MRITRDRMVDVLGAAPKPQQVWEEQFDYCNDELVQLSQTDWDKVDPADLCFYYFLDLAYVELQPDLFRYLFPACLKFWYETLMGDESAGYLTSGDFHYSLMQGQIVEKMLSPRERQSLMEFFRDGMLDRIESQSGFVYDPNFLKANMWIYRFNELGIVAPVIPQIWEAWWELDHPGKAVCAVMYASGLMYVRAENPVYRICTGTDWRGPFLTANGSLFNWAWRDDNLAFLRETLSVGYITRKLDLAAEALSDGPDAELARRVANDAKTRTDIIEIRIGDLLKNLGRLKLTQDRWE